MNISSSPLQGYGIRLLPMEKAHARALFEAGQAPEIWAYMPLNASSLEATEEIVRQALQARDAGAEWPFVVEDMASGRLVGSTRFLEIMPVHRILEIGWTWYTPAVWRTHVNTACKYLLLRYCFEELKLNRVQLKTDARNLRSQKAIERIGGVKEGVLRRHRILPDGFVRDTVLYSIIAEEWPSVRARLEGWLPDKNPGLPGSAPIRRP